jgi:hypothetical protein
MQLLRDNLTLWTSDMETGKLPRPNSPCNVPCRAKLTFLDKKEDEPEAAKDEAE